MRLRATVTVLAVAVLGAMAVAVPRAQAPGAPASDPLAAQRAQQAMRALDRYLETWNSRNPALWATSLHYPHVRPGAGPFEVSRTADEYAAGVDFAQTMRTGWHHSEWVSREVLQVGADKVHIAGSWRRYTADDQPQASSAITYIVTLVDGRWGVQSRFAAGTSLLQGAAAAPVEAAARAALTTFMAAWNGHSPEAVAQAIHYPHVRIADGAVEVWRSAEQFLAGSEPGRQRTWHQTRVDQVRVVQITANGVNMVVSLSRLGRDGAVLSTDEGVFLAALRDGTWRIQARSMMGT